ncbi:hypothetical protein DCC62_09605 [candidate division KSB1 bacterium]|nr:MAG: hypothetical protein DCC62_09605 [candidate division KSB1 bacterium]
MYGFGLLERIVEQAKKIKFGFSDAVKVYCNDRLLYGSRNNFLSRDYRFPGTIGLFGEIYFPLEAGDNELLMAITEIFGGWGLEAQLEGMMTSRSWNSSNAHNKHSKFACMFAYDIAGLRRMRQARNTGSRLNAEPRSGRCQSRECSG